MCHRVLDEHVVSQPRGAGALPGSEGRRRRRWASGAAVTLVGGLALAGWVDLQPGTPASVTQNVQPQAAVVPVANTATASTGSGSAPGLPVADDDVPSVAGKTPGAAGHCEHGL